MAVFLIIPYNGSKKKNKMSFKNTSYHITQASTPIPTHPRI